MREKAEVLLKSVLGSEAYFRDGQWEAIEALVKKRQRTLVVQRTGWGKSLVYFMATRLLREQGAGTTILVSPLLSLMRNQIDAARTWGLSAETINSTNPHDHARIESDLLANKIDLLLISPERLANDKFQQSVWPRLKQLTGLMVIDEAHCISDWGHDFRPNYRRIMRILDEIPATTPVLGTTATANDRVVADVGEILGAGMNIQRGPLTRDSLRLYVYPEPMEAAERLTLLSHLMKHIRGSGIIYCTTTRDCQQVADWLQAEGFNAKAYYADVESNTEETRVDLENQLQNNQVKALVASVALGMGFDKPDLHFVIHYQQPGNIISYYQQIGRAGRGIDEAHIILMHGPGDEDIQNYFIETAFPRPEQVEETVSAIDDLQTATRSQIQQRVNIRYSTLEKILTHLEVEDIIEKQGSTYQLCGQNRTLDYARWGLVTQQRYDELAQMRSYIQHDDCLMRFIASALDDPTPAKTCGRCKNCLHSQSKFQPDISAVEAARHFLRGGKPITLEARKRWPSGLPGIVKTTSLRPNEPGIALCQYYESGWGEQVRQARMASAPYSDDVIAAAVTILRDYLRGLKVPPTWIAPVPSLRRPQPVPQLAQRLAQALRLEYCPAVTHVQQHLAQGTMRNSYQQAQNVLDAFAVDGPLPKGPVLLVDDLADSKWTLTVIGDLLQQRGVARVYPFVLASVNASGGD